MNGLLACFVEVAIVGGGEVLALGEIKLLLLTLVADTLNDLLGIVNNAWVVWVGAFDDMNAILKKRPRVRFPTTITARRSPRKCQRLVRASIVTAAIVLDCFLRLTGVDLGGESLAAKAIYLAGNNPDIVVLPLGTKSCLVHFFKDFTLVNGGTILGLAIVAKICVEAGNEARIKAINKCLVYADW